MITDLKPYPSYRDSGVEWLGAVPAHWEVWRLKNTIYLQRGYDLDATKFIKGRYPVCGSNGIIGYHNNFKSSGPGITIGRSGSVGEVNYIASDFWPHNTAIYVKKYFNSDVRFIFYLLKTIDLKGLSAGSAVGTLNRNYIHQLAVTIPPLPEQTAIARVLDFADRRIRRSIQAKLKLIKLLEEEKQAVINQAVTRGLDPDVRLKPSGVEWLGDVPEHWEVMLNQRIFKEEIRSHNGHFEMQLSLSQKEGLIPTSTMQERSLQTSSYDNWKVTMPGDLVLNRFKAHLGVFFASTLRGIVSFHYGVFSPRRPLITKYFELLYHTNVYRTIYAGRSNGMTVGLQNLSNQNFYNVCSIYPPIREQRAIVSFAERSIKYFNDVIDLTSCEITLLREYRTRLISDVVTGKLDVREAAARLSEEAGEPGTLRVEKEGASA